MHSSVCFSPSSCEDWTVYYLPYAALYSQQFLRDYRFGAIKKLKGRTMAKLMSASWSPHVCLMVTSI
jgi:hypothetical protein